MAALAFNLLTGRCWNFTRATLILVTTASGSLRDNISLSLLRARLIDLSMPIKHSAINPQ
jgi:hypothetical protein